MPFEGGSTSGVEGSNGTTKDYSRENGTAYVVYHNYNVILRWNHSDYFATAVGILADRIAGGGPASEHRHP